MFRYLDTSLLRPGDVLLTRSGGWQSKAIALGTLGHYSHAALVCKEGMVFESDDDGVGFDRMYLVNVRYHNHQWVEWGRLSHGYHALQVYRHPEMEAVIPGDIRETIMAACRRYFGEPYAYMDRLASAVSICPDALRPLLRLLLRRLEDRKWISGLNGLFCSELVAFIYRDLGLKLFPGNSLPEAIAPNNLARSALRPVRGAVIPLPAVEAVRRTNPGLDTRGGDFPRKKLLTRLVRVNELRAQLDDLLK